MTRTRATAAALAVVLVAQAVLSAILLGHVEPFRVQPHALLLAAVSFPLWLVAMVLLSRLPVTGRHAAVLVLGVSAVLSIVAMTHPPSSSDDDYRYMWDAKVQLAGIDPYRYAPSDPALSDLRDGFLFGAPGEKAHDFPGGSTMINRPTVRTVYPPVGEAAFTAIRALSFGGTGHHLPLQLAGALGLLAIGWLLLRRGVRPWAAALWSWCPLTIVEFANNAHIDWLGVLFVVLALTVARRTWAVGALVGAAIAVKLYPALLLPALMRRSWLVAVAAAAFVGLVYVPHVIAVGADVLGYLPGYLKENDYGDGERFKLLSPLLGHPADVVVAALTLVGVALWAWLRGDRDRPERAAVVVVGVTFCVVTPDYGWYAGLLLVLIALSGSVEWLPVAVAPTFAYLVHPPPGGTDDATVWYGIAAALTLVVFVVRRRLPVRRTVPAAH